MVSCICVYLVELAQRHLSIALYNQHRHVSVQEDEGLLVLALLMLVLIIVLWWKSEFLFTDQEINMDLSSFLLLILLKAEYDPMRVPVKQQHALTAQCSCFH